MTLPPTRAPFAIILLIAVQIVCVGSFLADILVEVFVVHDPDGFFEIETLATVALILAIVFEIRILRQMLRRTARLETHMRRAALAFQDALDDYFDRWQLTPTERDVALFMIKGMTIAEIAALRASAEGTIKSHLNAIYRKAGVSGRGAFLALLIEDLMQDSDAAQYAPDAPPARPLTKAEPLAGWPRNEDAI